MDAFSEKIVDAIKTVLEIDSSISINLGKTLEEIGSNDLQAFEIGYNLAEDYGFVNLNEYLDSRINPDKKDLFKYTINEYVELIKDYVKNTSEKDIQQKSLPAQAGNRIGLFKILKELLTD